MRYPISEGPRELSITDFHFAGRADGVLIDRSGRSYLLYAPAPPPSKPAPPAALDDDVPRPARRVAHWVLYALWGAAAAATVWFVFIVPRAQGAPAPVRPIPASLTRLSASSPLTMEH
jgi:hypothetical protein